MNGIFSTDRQTTQPTIRLDIIVPNVGWFLALLAWIVTDYQSMPLVLRILLGGFAGITLAISVAFTTIPIVKAFKPWKRARAATKQRHRLYDSVSNLLQEATDFFLFDGSHSLPRYLESLCTAIVHDQQRHAALYSLKRQLMVVSGWHSSMVNGHMCKLFSELNYVRYVQDVIAMYNRVSDVLRELSSIDLPETPTIKAEAHRYGIISDRYNDHVTRLESLIANASQLNPELARVSFNRLRALGLQ